MNNSCEINPQNKTENPSPPIKIVLISTLVNSADLGLRTLSSVLKKAGYNVKIVFLITPMFSSKKFYSKKELKQLELICKNCDLIGVSAFSSTSSRAIQVIKKLKSLNKPIVWGGIHATLSPEDCIKYSDIVCVGEGEGAILDLAEAIQENKSIENIKNLWIRKNNKIIKNPVRNLIHNLDSLPFPDFEIKTHFILKKGKIRRFNEKDFNGEIIIMSGRGCPYSCDYCSNNALNSLYKGKRKSILRFNSVDYFIKELFHLKNKFLNTDFIEIIDDSFSLRPIKEIREFSKKYKQKIGLKFKALVDPRTATDEKIKLLADAGCYMLAVGIQATERVNKEIYHRNMTNKDILRCAKIFNKYKDKISVNYDVITCNPYEKPEDLINLIKLIQKIPKPYRLDVSCLIYFPKTKLTLRALKDGLITEKDLSSNLKYNDRGYHLLKIKKNLYLNLIVTLMRGVAIDNKIGSIKDSWFNYLLKEKRIKRNLKNPLSVILFVKFLILHDFIKHHILRTIYHNLPEKFKRKYLELKYKNKIVYTEKN